MNNTENSSGRGRYHHGDLKAQLIEATRQLVEEKGPDHFSVSEACRRAGVSTAAPYKHFKDKEEMLREVALAGMSQQQQQMIAALAPLPQRDISRIVALGQVYVNFATTQPGVFRLMFGLAEDHAEHSSLVEHGDGTFTFVQSEVARFHGRDTIQDSDKSQAFLLWSFVHGLSFLQIDGKLTDTKVHFDLDTVLEDIARKVVT